MNTIRLRTPFVYDVVPHPMHVRRLPLRAQCRADSLEPHDNSRSPHANPLRFPTATATFAVGIAGYLGVKPVALHDHRRAAGWAIAQGSSTAREQEPLLLTAVTGLAIAPLCAGVHRRPSHARASVSPWWASRSRPSCPPPCFRDSSSAGPEPVARSPRPARRSPPSATRTGSPASTDSRTAASSRWYSP